MGSPSERHDVRSHNTGSGTTGQRIDQWRDQVRRTCGLNLDVVVDRDTFAEGTILTSAIGHFRVSLISADAHSVYLSNRRASDTDGHVYVTVPLSGEAELSQDGGTTTVAPGEVVTFDSSRSYTLEMPQRFQMVALRFPHRSLGLTPDITRKLTSRPWPSSNGVGALVSQSLGTLGQQLRDLPDAAAEPLGMVLGGLVTTLFTDRLHDEEDDTVAARQMLLLRVLSYAKRHIADPALSPAVLAKKHNISLRYLQVIFAAQRTSPAKWIRDERLTGILADLNNPRTDHLTVAAIGERWGLQEPSQVSRLFRQRYGMTPREFRKLRQQGVDIPPRSRPGARATMTASSFYANGILG
ncbi:helix-turn-helix domain-containing protein [Actinosynnema sp. ALI-1.44]|uniref:AraC-like ligand-binding domain-containing protein n=1 Tax=Actinosynnema sp. ALI-1.44 TaxID=1933779 RepID=UPI00143D5525|nr:helix-turn-helix domain-containing protein [Actinosynnema sp. ALI-1.44]